MTYVPILCVEFCAERLDHDEVCKQLTQRKIESVSHVYTDPFNLYKAKHPDLDSKACEDKMFVSQCMMNEFFAGKSVEIVQIETINAIGGDLEDGSGNVFSEAIPPPTPDFPQHVHQSARLNP